MHLSYASGLSLGKAKDAEPIWRGVIEDVNGDKPVYFDHLDKMRDYFAKYLTAIGIKIDQLRK